MEPSVPMHATMRGRMDEESSDRPVNGWSNGGAYGGPHRPYDRDPHSIPVPHSAMRDSYDRPMSTPNHGMNSMHGHG